MLRFRLAGPVSVLSLPLTTRESRPGQGLDRLGEPPDYYAVLALDGDQVGRWLSGEMSPAVKSILSPKAVHYFRERMLPAEEAIECATDLRAASQGRRCDMSKDCAALFRTDAPEGFLWLASPAKSEPTWPLLVPGPRMTVSVGIAIGHVKEPLQDMIVEAQLAEKLAKANPQTTVFDRSPADPNHHRERQIANEGCGRDALAVTLFKRSGETIRWGAKFGSCCFPLLRFFQDHFRAAPDSPNTELPIDEAIAAASTELPDLHRDPFDRLLIATAIQHALLLATPDNTMPRYPKLKTLW